MRIEKEKKIYCFCCAKRFDKWSENSEINILLSRCALRSEDFFDSNITSFFYLSLPVAVAL